MNTEQLRWRARGGGGSFPQPVDVGGVVGACPNGPFPDVGGLRDDVVVGDVTTQFEVTVIYSAAGIGVGHEVTLDRERKRLPPEERRRGSVT